MTGKADARAHLDQRRPAVQTLFAAWAGPDAGVVERVNLVEAYFRDAHVGDVRRVASGGSIAVTPAELDPKRPTVLVVGRHGVADLPDNQAPVLADGALLGPGLASRLGPTVAFCEGFQAARALTVQGPINVSFLSLGDNDTFADVAGSLFTGNLDAVYATDAVCWNPHHPTVTVGARGQLVAELRLDAGQPCHDFVTSGAVRNPLTKLTQLLSAIRDAQGRIAIPGFYDRALPPDAELRSALRTGEHDPDEWSEHLGAARFGGELSSLERATLWPGASVLSIDSKPDDGAHTPAWATAAVALYLVPDQRPAEVERALRAWFVDAAPAELNPAIRVLSSTRPIRTSVDSLPSAAQVRAAFQLYGRQAVPVVAGGPAGAGEIAFAAGAPIGFAGIARPGATWASQSESLSWSYFEAGVAMAAETCLQLRRG